jgi:hypothetical protein
MDLAQLGTMIGGGVTGAATVAAAAWAYWQKYQREHAQTRATVAENNAETTVADAQRIVYQTLVDRVTTLETEQRTMRAELAAERSHNRQLVLHIWKLEGLMRAAGLNPPPFEDAGIPVVPLAAKT